MPKAIWNGVVIAETTSFETVEGNVYFPLESLDKKYFEESKHTSVCGWKGTANYFNVVVDGSTNANAAWIYKNPKAAAKKIQNHVAFWRGVKVEK
mmetsp:Transcript_565/g.753  ORF Transcript_565/g.753 Transcript_565/m.753 type:complete len:95 (-) Transcript_565:134-418(-)